MRIGVDATSWANQRGYGRQRHPHIRWNDHGQRRQQRHINIQKRDYSRRQWHIDIKQPENRNFRDKHHDDQ